MKKPSEASRVLRYPGSAIGVEGPRADIEWLVQFLGPAFLSRKKGEVDWGVRMVRDQAAYEKRLKSGPDPMARRRPCFYLDTRTETLPLWRGPRGYTTVFDRNHEVFAFVSKNGSGVNLLGPEEGRLPRLTLMRIVREHTLSRLMSRPGFLLHSSALDLDGKAALVVGEKRSGKTSLMLHFLWNGNGDSSSAEGPIRYLANDRVWLSVGEGAPRATGFPTISSLRLSSLRLFPEIEAKLEQSTWMPAATLEESRNPSAPPTKPWKGRKYTLSPRQLCRLVGVEASAAAEVGALLFPTVTGTSGRIRMTSMTSGEAEAGLWRGLFRAEDPKKAGGLFAAPGFPRRLVREDAARWIVDLARKVPCFSVELGLQAYSDRSWIRRLRKKLTEASTS